MAKSTEKQETEKAVLFQQIFKQPKHHLYFQNTALKY